MGAALHLAADPMTGEILAHDLTPSERHDGPELPGLLDAVEGPIEAARRIAEVGRKVWKTETGYPKRSLSKTAMVRFKKIIGANLKPRSPANQKTETSVAVRCLNSVTALGMPVGIKIAGTTAERGVTNQQSFMQRSHA